MIIPTAEPFFFPGSKDKNGAGCLLLHGFTGAPKEMRWMGEYLAGEGHAVLGMRLAGHATCPEDMQRIRRKDWIASVEDGYHILSGAAKQIFLVGLSMGGILSLLMASRLPAAGVVALSTPYKLPPDPRLHYIRLLQHVIRRVDQGTPDRQDAEAMQDHVCYSYYPTRVVIELLGLLDEMRTALPLVKVPALMIQSRKDKAIDQNSMTDLYNRISSRDKQMLWLEDSGHVITREPERMLVFKTAGEFIRRVVQQTPATSPVPHS